MSERYFETAMWIGTDSRIASQFGGLHQGANSMQNIEGRLKHVARRYPKHLVALGGQECVPGTILLGRTAMVFLSVDLNGDAIPFRWLEDEVDLDVANARVNKGIPAPHSHPAEQVELSRAGVAQGLDVSTILREPPQDALLLVAHVEV